MSIRLYIAILSLLLYGLWPGCESARADGEVSGGILYGAGQYRAEVAGDEVRNVSTNYQQISLRYNSKGDIGDTRLGKYTLMLGYEVNRIVPSISSDGIKDPGVEEIIAQKPFYQAAILLAPGGLPFRLSLFARDLHQSVFVDEGSSGAIPVGTQGSNSDGLIEREIFTGIENGTHREFGGTLLLGIRNGSYLGLYRDVLSQLPRLLIDYKQIEVRDLSRDRNQQHNRARDLAFVSLNKLDNWVHFRMHDYSDFLNPDNNFTNNQVIIGVIDQLMQRKWINMTNWLKISGDLSYTVEDEARKPAPVRTYLFNMMAVGHREHINTTVFSRFSRATDGRQVDFETELPMTMTLELDRDTRLRSRLIYDARERSLLKGTTFNADNSNLLEIGDDSTRDCYLDLQLEMFRSRNYVVVPRFEIESRSEPDAKEGLATRIGSEVYSNRKLSNALNWLGGYTLTVLKSEDRLNDASGIYLQNELYGRVDKEINRAWRVGGDASLAAGSGEGRQTLSFRIPTLTGQLQVGGGNGGGLGDSSEESSVTSGYLTLYFEHRQQRLENRLEFSAEAVAVDGITANQLSLRHKLNYEQTLHRFKWESVVNQGDNSGTATTVPFQYLGVDNESGGKVKTSWSSDANYSYNPSRSVGFTLTGVLSAGKTQSEYFSSLISERLVYRLFTTNGIIRRIAEFSEEIGYEKASAGIEGRDSSIFGLFSVAYFPTKYLYGKLRSEIASYPGNSGLQQVNIGEIGLDYEKLKLVARYSEGRKNRESAALPEVMERLWNIEVRKIF